MELIASIRTLKDRRRQAHSTTLDKPRKMFLHPHNYGAVHWLSEDRVVIKEQPEQWSLDEQPMPFVDLCDDMNTFPLTPCRPSISHSISMDPDAEALDDAFILQSFLANEEHRSSDSLGMESPMATSDLQNSFLDFMMTPLPPSPLPMPPVLTSPRISPPLPLPAPIRFSAEMPTPPLAKASLLSPFAAHFTAKVRPNANLTTEPSGNRGKKSVRKCEVEGCDRNSQSCNRCIRHGGGRRCEVEGCTRGAQARGKCKAHGGGVRCKVPGCTRSSQGAGLCRTHGGGKLCDYPGCKKGTQRHGKCSTHGGARRCKVEGCDKIDRGGGMCGRHRIEREMENR